MTSNQFDPHLRTLVEAQLNRGNASKRARRVANVIFQHGSCTTTDIERLGYKHPPRAIGDLRDAGITVTKEMEQYEDESSHAQKPRARYYIVDIAEGRTSRRPFSKRLVQAVKATGHCEVCGAYPPLQVDHRIPFEIGGERYPHHAEDYMPLCPSCNRSKSWSCEHCPNWRTRDTSICKTCFWASPEDYTHVATRQIRLVRGVLSNSDDIRRFDEQKPDIVKVLSKYMSDVDHPTHR